VHSLVDLVIILLHKVSKTVSLRLETKAYPTRRSMFVNIAVSMTGETVASAEMARTEQADIQSVLQSTHITKFLSL
jgi:hypothetical protein